MQEAAEATATTRERIMQVAENLLRTRSYLGFSFQDISTEVGIRKASLHHHFASKEVLGVEVIRAVTQRFKARTAGMPAAPEARLEAYFDMYRTSMHAGLAVCPGGSFAPGWECARDDLKAAVRELRDTQILWLTGVLGAMDTARRIGPPEVMAASVFAACQGGLIAARMSGKAEDFDHALGFVRMALLPAQPQAVK